ncbi:MAG TPA: serine/threonine protein kinase, partial [Kribbella sp.]
MTSTLSSNTVLGDRYRLIERIAAGGQGEVWRAQDTALGRPAALKVLRGEYADDAEFRERFRREARH